MRPRFRVLTDGSMPARTNKTKQANATDCLNRAKRGWVRVPVNHHKPEYHKKTFQTLSCISWEAHQKHTCAPIKTGLTLRQEPPPPPVIISSSILLHCSLQGSSSAHLKRFMYAFIPGTRGGGHQLSSLSPFVALLREPLSEGFREAGRTGLLCYHIFYLSWNTVSISCRCLFDNSFEQFMCLNLWL